MIKMAKLVLTMLLVILPPSLMADDATQRLNAALKNLDSLSADFKQTQLDEQKQVIQNSRGRLAIQRPGKFSWIYEEPFEQQIIADGKELWVYDVDLEQVTVKPMDEGLATTPIMILMRETGIEEEFTVSEVGQRKVLYWVELLPNDQDLQYTQVYLGIENDTVKAMELRDRFGQSTQIVFENLRTGVVHDPATFIFNVPAGVDVYGVGG